jgi:hypothetical protein
MTTYQWQHFQVCLHAVTAEAVEEEAVAVAVVAAEAAVEAPVVEVAALQGRVEHGNTNSITTL